MGFFFSPLKLDFVSCVTFGMRHNISWLTRQWSIAISDANMSVYDILSISSSLAWVDRFKWENVCCSPCGSAGKESACNVGDLGSIPGSRRSPGEGNSYPLQYSGLENSMDCVVRGVSKNQTWLRDSFSLCFLSLFLLIIKLYINMIPCVIHAISDLVQ